LTSAKDTYFEVKAQEVRMSIDILSIRKGKEEEEARHQTELFEAELEEKKLLVKQIKLKMLLMQASLRVQLLTEKKLKMELGEGEEHNGQVVNSLFITDEDEDDEFVEAEESFGR
jgi:hypothetical protein